MRRRYERWREALERRDSWEEEREVRGGGGGGGR